MWKPGQSGNPLGRASEQAFTGALRAALNQEDPRTKRRKLELVVDSLVTSAIAGESWAVTQIADRLDGKPHQTSTTEHVNRTVAEMTTEELLRIAAQGRVAEESETTH